MKNNYDVVVVGGGTAGCSAAYNSAKLGANVLLLESSQVLGGAMTSGLVVPVMKSGENQINTDFYTLLISEMRKINAQITYLDNPGWFNPELLKIVLDRILLDVGVDIVFNAQISDVKFKNNLINEIKILSEYNCTICDDKRVCSNKTLSGYIGTKYIIDATGDANFCKKISHEFLNDSDIHQPMSLRFIMSGINLEKFSQFLLTIDNDRNVTTVEYLNEIPHLSTAYTWDNNRNWALTPYVQKAIAEGVITETDVNYFQVFTIPQMPSSLAFNCPRIVKKLNPNDILDRTEAIIEARQSIYRISNFCKKYLKGFENAYISSISDTIGVRVSNRIKGKYVYTIDDLKSSRKFKNPALISNYPVDVHSNSKDTSTLLGTNEYQLPIESLMSNKYDNLFVVGRCLSADFMAQGALRVQSSCFSMGEAVAKYLFKN